MAGRKKKWEEIAEILRNRIYSQEYKPGDKFPTTLELVNEFGVHIGTIQQAVNALIQEGLVISHGSGSAKRTVRRLLKRSIRRGGFITEDNDHRQQVLETKIIENADELPEIVQKYMTPPVLYYATLQIRDEIPVAISRSYIPSVFPLDILKDILENPERELYTVMKTLKIKPYRCEESLLVGKATEDECKLFSLPPNNNVTVVNIERLVYSEDNTLLEFCLLTNRVDAYKFVYEFLL